MAICGNCGAEGTRIRSRWRGGQQLPDECPICAPQSFEKFTMPSDQKIWMGYEAHPNEYVQSADGGFDRKAEYRAEQEAKLGLGDADDIALQAKAEEEKRLTRRTVPLSPVERDMAIRKARLIAMAMEGMVAQAQTEADEAELQSWIEGAKQA